MHTNCSVFKTEQGQHICLRVDICLCWALFHESQVSVTDLRQILQFTGKKWGHQYIVRYWRRTAFITRWLSLWSPGFLCPFCFGPFSVPVGLSLVCFLLQLVLKRWHQNVIRNSSIKRNNLHGSVDSLFFQPFSPPLSALLPPAKGFQGGRSRSPLWFLITPVLHLSPGEEYSSAVIRRTCSENPQTPSGSP